MLILLPPSEKKSQTARPTPAIEVYTGVLYQALDWSSLTPAARKRGQSAVRIISAKYGAIAPDTRIESYKAKIDNKALRSSVAAALDPIATGLIIDCRSSTYKTVWPSPIDITVEIRITTVVDGVRTVVTHMSKKTRGEVTRHILLAGIDIKTPQELLEVVSQAFTCTLIDASEKEPWVLEVYC